MAALDVAEPRRRADATAKGSRGLDGEIQAANWAGDLSEMKSQA